MEGTFKGIFSLEKISFIGRVVFEDGYLYRIVYRTTSSRYQLIVFINSDLKPRILRSEKFDDGYKLVSRREIDKGILTYVERYLS